VKTYRIKLTHKFGGRHLSEIWTITAKNRAEARKDLRKQWRYNNGYSGIRFDDFQITFDNSEYLQ